jgi:transposase
MGRKPKVSKEEKVQACENYLAGRGSTYSIAKELNTHHEVIRGWCLKYKIHGPDAFDVSTRNNSYSKAFKLSVIDEYLSGMISTHDLASKYNISSGTVSKWINMYYNGVENKDYNPKGEVYTMKSRKTTFDERLEIVRWVIANDMNYKEAADLYGIRYALVYQWVQKYMQDGDEALKYKKRGTKPRSKIDEDSLDDMEKLKLELERERALRERAEFKLEVLKKKEEFEQKLRSRK